MNNNYFEEVKTQVAKNKIFMIIIGAMFIINIIAISYKRCKCSKCYTTTAILTTGNACNNLCCDSASGQELMWSFYFNLVYNCSILQHIIKIYQVAVIKSRLCEVVNIQHLINVWLYHYLKFCYQTIDTRRFHNKSFTYCVLYLLTM